MASVLIRMTTDSLGFSAGLLTRLSSSIFTFASTVAHLLAEVRAALELLSTNLSTTGIFKPALDIPEVLLAAHAALLYQKGAFWAGFIAQMTVVLDLRMAAGFGSVALVATRWWLSSTWQRRLQDSTATIAADLVKDGFPACTAWAFMAQLFANMIATFQRPTTGACTDMFWFEAVVDGPRR